MVMPVFDRAQPVVLTAQNNQSWSANKSVYDPGHTRLERVLLVAVGGTCCSGWHRAAAGVRMIVLYMIIVAHLGQCFSSRLRELSSNRTGKAEVSISHHHPSH